MGTFIFVMCILAPGGYCADVVEERHATKAECMALVQQYRHDRRVLVSCRPEGRVQ